jgi:hypothetical protein
MLADTVIAPAQPGLRTDTYPVGRGETEGEEGPLSAQTQYGAALGGRGPLFSKTTGGFQRAPIGHSALSGPAFHSTLKRARGRP